MSESVVSDYGSEDVAQQTIAIITQLKAENVDLKRNFENLKALHLQLSENYKGLQGRYSGLYEERNNVEKQYQSLCESWRIELEEKQKQLEATKAQILGPRDLEVLRVKLLEELEAPYRAKCDNLAREAESSHQAYVKLRRDYEELQNTYRSLEVRTVGDQEAHRLEVTALTRDARDKTAQLLVAQNKLATAETNLRALHRDLEAARYSSSQMKQELEEVRRQKEKAVVERENAAVAAEKRVKAAEDEAQQLMAFVESVNRKNRHLVQELADSQRSAEDLFAANVRLQSAQVQLQAQLESATRVAAQEKASLLAEHEEAVQRLEDKLTASAAEAARRESLVAELKLAQQEELTKLVATWEVRLAEERRASAERARELMDQKADASERAAAQQRLAEEMRREAEANLRAAQGEADNATRQAATETARCEGLSKQVSELQLQLDSAKAELAEIKSEMVRTQMTCQQLAEKRSDMEARLKAQEEAVVQARAARDALASELEAVRREAEVERDQAARHSDSARAAWALEKAALAKRYQAAIKELGARHEAELRRVKRKAKGAHVAVAALTDEVAELKFKAAEAQHATHMSEVLYLGASGGPNTARSASPFRDRAPYSPGGIAGADYYHGYSPSRPTTAPSFLPSAPQPNVVIVTGNGAGGGAGVAAAAAAGAAAGAASAHQQQQQAEREREVREAEEGEERGAMVDQALLSSIAALRHRQQQYMDAARLGPV
ncbi:hypothetical protein HYH03_012732 [Edaphochlamys debaryana]|uniref:Uncharacterized protein n=1 Tax=Edaphochlamys debaryana TaxID=47281 RepID=A0A835XR60_9CHLO|nr:hypothetical protein HYH03_012732 [Edaphochlamys debaryana]|eukprot:KAG2488733.1 hypothetical protein HYH03_012732 [Edaphochlamys debaryana]